MRVVTVESVSWSHRRWFWTLVLTFAGHVGLVWWLAPPQRAGVPWPVPLTPIRFTSDNASEGRFGTESALSDPTLFALANPHGFSGEAWLTMQPFAYELTNRLEPPRCLTDNPTRLAADFRRFVDTGLPPVFDLPGRPPLALLPAAETSPPMIIQARLRVEGDLAGRRLLSDRALPEPDPGAVPTNCVVRVAVSSEGDVFSAVVWSTSGYPAVDKKALTFAKSARFEPNRLGASLPLPGRGTLGFGTLIFQWSLVPASAGEGSAAKP